MKSITLYQPRHLFAPDPEEGEGHIYLPSSLSTVAGRLIAAGVDAEMQDGNLRPPSFEKDAIGMNVIGAPYIPTVIALQQDIRRALGDEIPLLLGGQVISGLSESQFQRLFGPDAHNGNNDDTLKQILGLHLRHLPAPEETSHIPVYEQMPDEDFAKYLANEFCLYLSQGCKYACDFCAAVRTSVNPATGEKVQIREQYRNLAIIDEELRYMVVRAQRLELDTLSMYLSNLDTFQTPDKLKAFAQLILAIKKDFPGFKFRMRGLATAKEFMNVYRKDKEVIQLMTDAGLWSIGFGVDGTSPQVWKSIKKGQNKLPECIEAIRLTRVEFGITPEIFMVVGHAQDTEETMLDNVAFVLDMAEQFGAAPRPHVAKSIIPGNSGWHDPANAELVEQFMRHPELFVSMDYTAFPTDPDIRRRYMIEQTFMMMTSIVGNTTKPIYPPSPEISDQRAKIYARLNMGRFDR